jgi:hypothetical protein
MFYKVEDKSINQLIKLWANDKNISKTEIIIERLLGLKFYTKILDEKFKGIYYQIIFSLSEVLSENSEDSKILASSKSSKWKLWNWDNLYQVRIVYNTLSERC